MEKNKNNRPWTTKSESWIMWLGLCFLLFGNSCYEPKEGCLDAEATNFDANADDICPNCCEYPTLKVSFLHKIATSDTSNTNLVYNIPYTVDSLHYFKINQIRFYISDIQLRQTDGSWHTTTDSIDLKIPQLSGDTSEIRVPNNYILVDRNNFQDNTLGNFRKNGNFDGIQFQLGIAGQANHADPNQLADNHPLSIQEDSMHWNTTDGYIFNNISLFPDTLVSDSIPISIAYGQQNVGLRTINLNEPFFIPQGFDVTLVLQINYLKWFEGLDFQNVLTSQTITTIANNAITSFSLVEIKLE